MRDIETQTRDINPLERLGWCFEHFGLPLVAVSFSTWETHVERQGPGGNTHIKFISNHFVIPSGQKTCNMGAKGIMLHTGVDDTEKQPPLRK